MHLSYTMLKTSYVEIEILKKFKRTYSPRKISRGFTLVELSIVIVIIGLIVAGVTSGQSLVRQSKLRSVVNIASSYRSAFNSFFMQYNGYPGDLAKAASYWGNDCNGGGGGDTCSGNGDGTIAWADSGINESFRAWSHLAKAGLILGTYNGVNNGASQIVGLNLPAGPLKNSGYTINHVKPPTASGQASYAGPLFHFGALGVSYGAATLPILSVDELSGLDNKFDDGAAFKGKIRVRSLEGPNCISGSAYNLSFVGTACAAIFTTDFSR